METRGKIGVGGIGVDLMAGVVLAVTARPWLWVIFAIGAAFAFWGFLPLPARMLNYVRQRFFPKAIEAAVPARMTVVDFVALARDRFGWDFGMHSLEPCDLERGTLQAAVDGDLCLFGRDVPEGCSESLIPHYVLVEIPPEHFQTYRLNVIGYDDNVKSKTYAYTSGGVKVRYCDLHVDSAKAVAWLQNGAEAYRGMTAREKAS